MNLHKGPNIAGKDPVTRRTTDLFNPRKNHWEVHFSWRRAKLVGLTAVGRTTIQVLNINDPAYLLVRSALLEAGLFEG